MDWDVAMKWAEEKVEDWKAAVPASYGGLVKDIPQSEIYDLVVNKKITKWQFWDWLDQRTWDMANDQLKKDMENLLEEEGEWDDWTNDNQLEVDQAWEKVQMDRGLA